MLNSRFKQTEVGAIPEDWEVVPLGGLISSVEYGSSAKSNAKGHTPVLRMGNLRGGKIDWNDLVFIRVHRGHDGERRAQRNFVLARTTAEQHSNPEFTFVCHA